MDTNDISPSYRSRLTKEQRRRTVAYGYGLTKSTAPKEDRSQVMPAIDPGYRTSSRTEPYRPEGLQRTTTSGLLKDQMLPRRKREELLDEACGVQRDPVAVSLTDAHPQRRQTWQQPPYHPQPEQSISPPTVVPMPAKSSISRSDERSTHSSSSHSVLTKLLAVADRNEALMRSLLARMDAMDLRMEALASRMDEA